MDTEATLLTDVMTRLQQAVELQEGIVRDCAERADYWRSLGCPDRAQIWTDFADNAARVLAGMQATGDPEYCPF